MLHPVPMSLLPLELTLPTFPFVKVIPGLSKVHVESPNVRSVTVTPNPNSVTGQVNGILHILLQLEPDMTEILFAHSNGRNFPASLEGFPHNVIRHILGQSAHKHGPTTQRLLSRGWKWSRRVRWEEGAGLTVDDFFGWGGVIGER